MTNEEFERDAKRLAEIYRDLGERQSSRAKLSMFGTGGMPLPPDKDHAQLLAEANTLHRALGYAIVHFRTPER